MFGSKKTDDKNIVTKTVVSPANGLNSLVKGTKVEGNIESDNDIRVDGTIIGTLHCNAKVIIGPDGYIDGEVRCVNAMIEGKFNGTIKVQDTLMVKETAEVNGDVTTSKLSIASGAIFNVICKMTENIVSLNDSKSSKVINE
jgi:cytoskeletal protein CcmA (bactofilin family)